MTEIVSARSAAATGLVAGNESTATGAENATESETATMSLSAPRTGSASARTGSASAPRGSVRSESTGAVGMSAEARGGAAVRPSLSKVYICRCCELYVGIVQLFPCLTAKCCSGWVTSLPGARNHVVHGLLVGACCVCVISPSRTT